MIDPALLRIAVLTNRQLHHGTGHDHDVLTDTQIRKLRVPEKDTKLWDERGLFLFVTASGGKRWRFKYRFAGKEKLLAIGIYPDVSLGAAREARDDARRKHLLLIQCSWVRILTIVALYSGLKT